MTLPNRRIDDMQSRGELGGQAHGRLLAAAACFCDLLLLAMQIGLVARFTGEQLSDARTYLDLARFCAENGTWYPMPYVLYANYVFGNGYINMLGALMRISPDTLWIGVLGIVCMQIVIFSCADIAYRLTGRKRAACLTVILLCLMGGFWGEPVQARTEMSFIAFACLSLCLMLHEGTPAFFLSGMALAVANWIRPLMVVYLPAMLLYMLWRRVGWRRIAAMLMGAALVIVLIGAGSYRRIGKFVYQAQTMGINMMMGANDDADGGYVGEVYDEGRAGYIAPEERRGMTFDQVDSHYRQVAVDWIIENPVKFLSLIPAKLFYFLGTDTYGGSAFFNNERETDGLSYLLELGNILLGRGERALQTGDVVVILSQLTYMLVFLGYLASIVAGFRQGWLMSVMHLHLIFLLACGVTVLTVGGARYHMPYIPIFCICTAIWLDLAKAPRRG